MTENSWLHLTGMKLPVERRVLCLLLGSKFVQDGNLYTLQGSISSVIGDEETADLLYSDDARQVKALVMWSGVKLGRTCTKKVRSCVVPPPHPTPWYGVDKGVDPLGFVVSSKGGSTPKEPGSKGYLGELTPLEQVDQPYGRGVPKKYYSPGPAKIPTVTGVWTKILGLNKSVPRSRLVPYLEELKPVFELNSNHRLEIEGVPLDVVEDCRKKFFGVADDQSNRLMAKISDLKAKDEKTSEYRRQLIRETDRLEKDNSSLRAKVSYLEKQLKSVQTVTVEEQEPELDEDKRLYLALSLKGRDRLVADNIGRMMLGNPLASAKTIVSATVSVVDQILEQRYEYMVKNGLPIEPME